MVRQMIRIGLDGLDGYVDGGIEAWRRARLPVSRVSTVSPEGLHAALQAGDGPLPLDVHFDTEWRTDHVPGAVHVELGELPDRASSLSTTGRIATLCAAGVRASTAASILEREGFTDVAIVQGGTEAWRDAGLPLDSESS